LALCPILGADWEWGSAAGIRRHDDGVRWAISKLEAAGDLAPGLTTIQATGLLSTLCSFEAFAELTTR